MAFEGIYFIKPNHPFDPAFTGRNQAPMFRRRFSLDSVGEAWLTVCGLGFARYYLNGVEVTEDRFIAPVSDYTKTLWYTRYEVSSLLREGENVLAVWCGNGWYNEEFKSSWSHDTAPWRDQPKFIAELTVNGRRVLESDGEFVYTEDNGMWFNALRSGECTDLRRLDPSWVQLDFDDSGWTPAAVDTTPPQGVFRECVCEPIREFEHYPARSVMATAGGKFVFDIGQNISGYVKLTVQGRPGQELTLRYAEEIHEDGSLKLNRMFAHYFESDFQTDRLILSGERVEWSPQFVYHGFRYVEIEGLEDAEQARVEGIFVHQAVEKRTDFECSDPMLNAMFRAGQFSVYSNMFYSLTDCPTREKLGWANDAQASAEQILTNFKSERFFKKWLQDIYDAMREDGALPGIIPTPGWGYDWGNGPVSEGVLYEIPYRLYRHTGDPAPLVDSIPYFDRHLAFLESRRDERGFVTYGLDDWVPPKPQKPGPTVPKELINSLLIARFYEIAALAAQLAGGDGEAYTRKAQEWKERVKAEFLDEQGRCTVPKQTAVAMLIYYGAYGDLAPLKEQLQALIEENGFHHDCGMVGIRRLYEALNRCGLEETAYRLVTARGYPSVANWLEHGATTLWEVWDIDHPDCSKNHHMFSDFMSWMVKTILGVRCLEPGFTKVEIAPYFFKELEFARGVCRTHSGDLRVDWRRRDDRVELELEIPEGVTAMFGGRVLSSGCHSLTV